MLLVLDLNPLPYLISSFKSGGDGGIRTLGTLLRFASLAKKYFRPLSHVSEA